MVVRRTNGTITATWPTIISGIDSGSPSVLKNISAASPKARVGRISGDMKSASSVWLHHVRRRVIASAAAVPSTTAIVVDEAATTRLCQAAVWICADWTGSKRLRYQRSDIAGGGKRSERESVNDVISTTTTGTIKISSAAALSRPSATRYETSPA